MSTIRIVATALPILIEDLGRPGFADIAVPASGAFDRASAALAQRLVGNPGSAAGLELTLGRASLEIGATATACVTGAPVPMRVAGRPVSVNTVFSWPAGARLELGAPPAGLRNYLAVRGGLRIPGALGSASSDTLSGIGPAPLREGDTVALAHDPAGDPEVTFAAIELDHAVPLRIVLGPRDSWFTDAAIRALASARFAVSAESSRVGLRLTGPRLGRRERRELPSEPLQRGAVQVPPSGLPIIMGPDHPTTGGYPVIGCLVESDWDRCGQLRPGDEVSFRVVAG